MILSAYIAVADYSDHVRRRWKTARRQLLSETADPDDVQHHPGGSLSTTARRVTAIILGREMKSNFWGMGHRHRNRSSSLVMSLPTARPGNNGVVCRIKMMTIIIIIAITMWSTWWPTHARRETEQSAAGVAAELQRNVKGALKLQEWLKKELNDHNQRWVQGTRVFERRLGNDDSIGIGSSVFCIASDSSDRFANGWKSCSRCVW